MEIITARSLYICDMIGFGETMKFKVLLSDDEPWILKALQQRIPWDSMDLELSATAGDGIDCLKKARETRPDLLITDVRMPGLTGLEIAEKLKHEIPDLKIILISGFTDFEYARKGIELGVLGYLLKPIQQNELESILREAVDELKKKSSEIDTDWRQFRKLIDRGFRSGHLPELLSTVGITDSSESALCVIGDRNVAIPMNDFHGSLFNRGIGRSLNLSILSGTSYQCDEFIRLLKDNRDTGTGIAAVGNRVLEMNYLGEGIRNTAATYCRGHFGEKEGFLFHEELPEPLQPLIDNILKSIDIGNSELTLSAIKVVEKLCREGGWPVEELLDLVNALIIRNLRRFRFRPATGLVPYPIGDELELASRFPTLEHVFETVHEMVSLLLSTSGINPEEGPSMIRIRQYMETHFSDDIHLGMLEESFNIEKNLISQGFRSTYDMSISEFLKSIRMRHAEYLLRNTNLPVNTISDLCGYSDYYYFAKLFKKSFGKTCSQYRTCISA